MEGKKKSLGIGNDSRILTIVEPTDTNIAVLYSKYRHHGVDCEAPQDRSRFRLGDST